MSELEQRFAELLRDRDLVLVCQVGSRSLKATYFLMHQGYTRVANMEGGLFKWASKGLPDQGRQAAGGCGHGRRLLRGTGGRVGLLRRRRCAVGAGRLLRPDIGGGRQVLLSWPRPGACLQ